MTITTLGLDLASKPKSTALCVIGWSNGAAEVVALCQGRDDAGDKLKDRLIVAAMRGTWAGLPAPSKVAIDAPLGWPVQFIRALSVAGRWPAIDGDRKGLERRATDHWVHRMADKQPLSVTTDRIAYPAMRAAGLLSHVAATGEEVIDVSGMTGLVCETYPDPAIRRLGLWPPDAVLRQSYKGDATALRATIMARLHEAAPWLALSAAHRAACIQSDDCLDALVCALMARAVAQGKTIPPPVELAGTARSEGWIHLPPTGFAIADLL